MEVVEARCWMARDIAGQADGGAFNAVSVHRSESNASVERDMLLL